MGEHAGENVAGNLRLSVVEEAELISSRLSGELLRFERFVEDLERTARELKAIRQRGQFRVVP